jgi:hypothetical protein
VISRSAGRYLRPLFLATAFLATAGAAGFSAALGFDPLLPAVFTAGLVAGFWVAGGAGFRLAVSGVFTAAIGAGFCAPGF